MRVKISYTVDLEEVPEKVRAIVNGAVATSVSELEETNHTFKTHLLEKGDIQSSIADLRSLREVLYKADQQLSDCVGLLNNLQEAHTAINKDKDSDE